MEQELSEKIKGYREVLENVINSITRATETRDDKVIETQCRISAISLKVTELSMKLDVMPRLLK